MNAVEKVEDLAKGERHLTREESRYWCNQYLQMCRALAIELDQARMQLYTMQYAKPEMTGALPKYPEIPIEVKKEIITDAYNGAVEQKLSKSQAISKRMKAYWANERAKKAR